MKSWVCGRRHAAVTWLNLTFEIWKNKWPEAEISQFSSSQVNRRQILWSTNIAKELSTCISPQRQYKFKVPTFHDLCLLVRFDFWIFSFVFRNQRKSPPEVNILRVTGLRCIEMFVKNNRRRRRPWQASTPSFRFHCNTSKIRLDPTCYLWHPLIRRWAWVWKVPALRIVS